MYIRDLVRNITQEMQVEWGGSSGGGRVSWGAVAGGGGTAGVGEAWSGLVRTWITHGSTHRRVVDYFPAQSLGSCVCLSLYRPSFSPNPHRVSAARVYIYIFFPLSSFSRTLNLPFFSRFSSFFGLFLLFLTLLYFFFSYLRFLVNPLSSFPFFLPFRNP